MVSSVDPRVGVVGAGYVGLTSAACLAHLGSRVCCVDIDQDLIARLRSAEVDLVEPGLADLVSAGLSASRLEFSDDLDRLVDADIVLLCLPTPPGADGEADLGAIESVLEKLAGLVAPGTVVVTKSTVPVGTSDRAAARLGDAGVVVVSNPEFLREGCAVDDFLHPDRVVIGRGRTSADRAGGQRVADLYAGVAAPVFTVSRASAELAKYASNSFLALKITYANELSELSERLGADIEQVTDVLAGDTRIGPAGLRPGPGWGGSCLPKDTRALLHAARSVGLDFGVLREAVRVNAEQPCRVVGKVAGLIGRPFPGARVGLLGLTFKAGTADLRDSAALAVARELAARGAVLTAYDPAVPAPGDGIDDSVQVVDDPYLVGKDAHAIIVLTEWPEFRDLDWIALAGCVEQARVLDTRNVLDLERLRAEGFHCVGTGRGTPVTD
jgi:UDPglucose 6-dehydrogenase